MPSCESIDNSPSGFILPQEPLRLFKDCLLRQHLRGIRRRPLNQGRLLGGILGLRACQSSRLDLDWLPFIEADLDSPPWQALGLGDHPWHVLRAKQDGLIHLKRGLCLLLLDLLNLLAFLRNPFHLFVHGLEEFVQVKLIVDCNNTVNDVLNIVNDVGPVLLDQSLPS